jgi:hypothetical protein
MIVQGNTRASYSVGVLGRQSRDGGLLFLRCLDWMQADGPDHSADNDLYTALLFNRPAPEHVQHMVATLSRAAITMRSHA